MYRPGLRLVLALIFLFFMIQGVSFDIVEVGLKKEFIELYDVAVDFVSFTS